MGTWNVTGAYDKASYNQGEVMTMTISGDYVAPVVTQQNAGPLTVSLQSDDGSVSSIVVPTVVVNVTTQVHQNVVITSIVDGSGRTWTIAGNGKSATATA
jgi:hypothetical protein